MKPNTMRRIDWWIGIPVCFVITLFARIHGLFRRRSVNPPTDPSNILLIELIEMGTLVVACPAIKALRTRYPQANVHFLCFKSIESSVEILGAIDKEHILTIDSGSLLSLVKDTLRFPWLARSKRIDTVINLEAFVRYSSVLTYLSGAPNRVGFHRFNQEGIYTGDFLTHKVSFNPHVHTAHTFLDLIHALDSPSDEIPRVKRPSSRDDLSIQKRSTKPSQREAIWSLLKSECPGIEPGKPLVIVNPNASKLFEMRKLPLESYVELVRRLIADDDVYVPIIGIAEEKPDAAHIQNAVKSPRVIDLTGKTTLPQLLDLFNVADVLITNDSGPAHFAALTDIHIVVFFGPELPERYRPLSDRCDVVYANYTCSPCVSPFNQRLTPCNNNLCLQTMDMARVHELVSRRLRDRQSSGGRESRPGHLFPAGVESPNHED